MMAQKIRKISMIVGVSFLFGNAAQKDLKNNHYNYSQYLKANDYANIGFGYACKEQNENGNNSNNLIQLSLAKVNSDTLLLMHATVNLKELTAELKNYEYYVKGVSRGSIDNGAELIITKENYYYQCAQKIASIRMKQNASIDKNNPETSTVKIDTFNDLRDGKTYKYVTLFGNAWMAQNLNYKPKYGSTWCYDNDAKNCKKFGRLYDWYSAQTACPEGWHLPTVDEWDTMIDSLGDTSTAGDRLKSNQMWDIQPNGSIGNGTDEFGFGAVPSGFYNGNDSFYHIGKIGIYWTATQALPKFKNDHSAYDRQFYGDKPHVFRGDITSDLKCGLAVRCVQNK